MAVIDNELAAFESMRAQLESERMGKWVVVQGGQLVGTYDSFEAATEDAVRKFSRSPYLIRQVGAPPIPARRW